MCIEEEGGGREGNICGPRRGGSTAHLACVMIAGDSAKLSTAPKLSARMNNWRLDRNAEAMASPPFR